MARKPIALLAVTLLTAAGLALACTRRSSEEAGREQALTGQTEASPARFDFGRPLDALRMSADEAARRGGPFSWEARVSWSVAKPGVAAVRASEVHRLRQLATGEFDVSADVDPGLGPGSETGKQVVFANGMTYARGRSAPFRERPTDRGTDARRFRDDSFRAAGDLAQLLGKAVSVEAAGETAVLGRRARRYVLSLSGSDPAPGPAPAGLPDGGYDPDTRRHVDLLEGRVPTAFEGALLLDAATGVPLSVVMKGALAERSDPQLRAEFDLDARVTALGGGVVRVAAPPGALPDDRKPKGVARALEASGLRQRADRGQAPEDGEDEAGDEGEGGAR